MTASSTFARESVVRPTTRRLIGRAVWYLCMVSLSVVCLMPFFWMITVSLRETGREITVPVQWLPDQFVWQNYVEAITGFAPGQGGNRDIDSGVNMLRALGNTLIMAGANVAGSILVGSLVAYAFARLSFPGRNLLFGLVLATMMLPSTVTLLPHFLINKQLGWVNTLWPFLALPFLGGGAFNIFLFRQFYGGIPRELDEAALIDGAGHLRIWWSIILPLSRPVMAVVGIFSFFASWNDFITPLIYLTNKKLFPLALALYALGGSSGASFVIPRYNLMMAGATLLVLPVIIIFFCAQRFFMRGIQIAGVMGK